MLGLPDDFHAFVLFQRFRQRCRSRVTDVVEHETARMQQTHKQIGSWIVLDQKEDATQVVLRAAVARAGLPNPFHRVVSQPTDGIVQVPCCSCHCITSR